MISILWMIVSFIIALMVLVAIHEYGHFIVARWLGVKVLRFSIGFGRVLLSWRDKKSTQYAISAIPLGGYVKMLDEREGPVPEELRDQRIPTDASHRRSNVLHCKELNLAGVGEQLPLCCASIAGRASSRAEPHPAPLLLMLS